MSLQKGLVLHVPLNQESYNSATKRFSDKTPYSNHGTSANAASFTTDRMGNSNQATTFNGISDYVGCGNDDSLSIVDALTVSIWINLDTQTLDSMHILSKRTATTGFYIYESSIADQKVGFICKVGNVSKRSLSDDALTVGDWHHFVGVYDGANVMSYVNSVKQSEINAAVGGIDTNAASLDIGRYSGVASWIKGNIADVRIYNRALTQTEITSLYESYKPQTSIGSASKGLVLDMPLHSPYTKDVSVAGSEVMTDRTPYSNDGTNHGATISSDPAVFNGSSDYVDCGNDESLDFGTDDYSFSLWLKRGRVGVTEVVIDKRTSEHIGFALWISSDNKIQFRGDGSGHDVKSDVVLTDAVWYFISLTNNRVGDRVLTIDNTSKTSSYDSSGLNITNSNDLRIGTEFVGTTYAFNGSIADVSIYNRSLNASEIKAYYDETKHDYR